VNTSLTCIDLAGNEIGDSNRASINALVARNKHLRSLFLFDAQQMLLSLMHADDCGVVCSYVLNSDDLGDLFGSGNTDAPGNIAQLRAEFAAVVNERYA
jgi:hypothetical protein